MSFFRRLWNAVEQGVREAIDVQGLSSSSGVIESNEIQSGDVDIKRLVIMSPDRSTSHNLIQLVTRINIYEDILMPLVTAELFITDSTNFFDDYRLFEGHFVSISIQTPGTNNPTEYMFRVRSLTDRSVMSNGKSVKYKMNLVSAELTPALDTLVSQSYEQEVHKSVVDIMKDKIGTQKKINTDPTAGIDRFIVPNMPPLVAIDMLRLRAIDRVEQGNPTGGLWLFFENKNGFNFTTVQKLLKRGREAQRRGSDKIFYFDSSPNTNADRVSFRDILAFRQISSFDMVLAQDSAMFSSTRLRFDRRRGMMNRIDFKSSERPNEIGTTTTSGFKRERERSSGTSTLHIVDTSLPESFITEMLAARASAAAQIAQNITHIETYGDTDITAGDVIMCNFPEFKDDTRQPQLSKLTTGNYMVSKIKHKISTGDRARHLMTVELIKGTVIERL